MVGIQTFFEIGIPTKYEQEQTVETFVKDLSREALDFSSLVPFAYGPVNLGTRG